MPAKPDPPTTDEFTRQMYALKDAVAKAKRSRMLEAAYRRRRAGAMPRATLRYPNSRKSPYRGVSWNRRDSLWVARIKVAGRSIHLGLFLPDRAEDAARQYDFWAWHYFGPTAVLNFPEHAHAHETTYAPPPGRPPDEPGEKDCSRCLRPRPLAEFHRRGDRASGRRSYCKWCEKKLYRGPVINKCMPREML